MIQIRHLSLRCTLALLGASLAATPALRAQQPQPVPTQANQPALSPAPAPNLTIDAYIHGAWKTLERSMTSCTSLVDPKVKSAPVLYLPRDYPEPAAVAGLRSKCGVRVERLPVVITHIGQPVSVPTPGLLYLPHPYVVPGGRFNEMYGWDSYFILLGLLHDGRLDRARGIVENFFFEIQHYGGILNANRTYYFTRSQPPFLSSMIRGVYEAQLAAGQGPQARAWLGRAYRYAQRDHALWTTPAQRAGSTGLARYYDYGEGPVPEMGDDPAYYQTVIQWLLAHPQAQTDYLVDGPGDPAPSDRAAIAAISCDPAASAVCAQAHVGPHWLSRDFYKGDRAMRESGFDTTFRFGAFSGSTDRFAPVCLNALLYKYERDLAWMAQQLGKPADVARWNAAAAARREAINRWLWNPAKGLYFDYDFIAGKPSTYNYVTTFYPLWAGAANADQARQVESHLRLFEKPGGLALSTTDSGVQWDLPFGWAPVEWLAVDGMRRFGDTKDALRVSREFVTTVSDNFSCDHTIHEKYNVVTGSSDIQVSAGYTQNVVGFGWTNAVFLAMQDLLERAPAPAARPAPCIAHPTQPAQ
ncbi:MAG TPA: trehalase family glycosidase [Acidobacteriaceae bacterium]|jgi:alpha,alpha-trehalase|nr:trehalase family glycosidase [Acidobacteriaceae bacterium]